MPLHQIKRKDILKFIEKAKLAVFPPDSEEAQAIDRSDLVTEEDLPENIIDTV